MYYSRLPTYTFYRGYKRVAGCARSFYCSGCINWLEWFHWPRIFAFPFFLNLLFNSQHYDFLQGRRQLVQYLPNGYNIANNIYGLNIKGGPLKFHQGKPRIWECWCNWCRKCWCRLRCYLSYLCSWWGNTVWMCVEWLARDVKTYRRAHNVGVKKIQFWVKSLQNFTLFCQESE